VQNLVQKALATWPIPANYVSIHVSAFKIGFHQHARPTYLNNMSDRGTVMLKRATTAIYSRLCQPTLLALAVCCAFPASANTATTSAAGSDRVLQRWPALPVALPADAALEQRVSTILSKMTLEQKIAQMIQPEIRDITVEDMRKYGFGSYLNGGGAFPNNNKHATAADWIKLADDLYQASIDASVDGSSIPTMWGTDAVHGHNNVIGATIFPHNIGLGAAHDSTLIEQIAKATAAEVRVTGIDWIFAPTVAVVRDDRWGRTYEGYSEDPEIVRSYAAAIVRGLQGDPTQQFLTEHHVISTVKHFLGDGGTEKGIDQGNNIASEQQLIDLHAQGYVGGLTAGAQTVMASFNSWHGEKNHGNKYLLTDVLKTRMGFDGFVVGDWNGHGQIPGCTNENCPQAANAGLDMYMVPTGAWKPLYENLLAQARSGEIAQSRVDDAVKRILRVKLRAGLFDREGPAKRALSAKTELLGAKAHRDIAKTAVRKSMVLLKNNDSLLPISPKQRILVAGSHADDIGLQSGGWTISWQGTGNTNSDFPGGTSIYQGFAKQVKQAGGSIELAQDGTFKQKPDVAIVVFGELPYAEGNGDIDNLEFQRGNKTDLALLKQLKAQGIKVVSLFVSGRPMWVNPEINQSDAFVALWLPGSEGDAVADVILQKNSGGVQHDFNGKLSFSWPLSPNQTAVNRGDKDKPLFPYGFGLTYTAKTTTPMLSEDPGHSSDSVQSMVLFERSPKAPWQFVLQNGEQTAPVIASVQNLAGLQYKAVDKVVQEDARSLAFSGTSKQSLLLLSNFPRDMRRAIEQQSALRFEIKLQQPLTTPLTVTMRCGELNGAPCDGEIDVQPLLQAHQQWQTVSVDLRCFQQKGVDFSRIAQSFSLESSHKAAITLGKVEWVPGLKANKNCP
jgi:beta-glucosidase